jgi:hypothetical protein
LGLSMISGSGGRLMVSLTEATRLANSRLSSVDRFNSGPSSHDAFKRSSAATRVYNCSRFSFRREVTFVAAPNITPPPITRQVSWWGFIDPLSESEMIPDLRGATTWRAAGAGNPVCWLVLAAEMSLTFLLRRRLFGPHARLFRYSKPR